MFMYGLSFTFFAAALLGLAVFIFIYANYDAIESQLIERYQGRILWFSDRFEKMFLKEKWTQERVYALAFGVPIFLGLTGVMILFLSASPWYVGLIITVLFFAFGWFGPKLAVGFLFNRRVTRFEAQLVDALSMIANSLKSGLSFIQGIQLISQNMGNPISQEFSLVLHQQQIGSTIDDALINLGDRVPSDDLGMIVNAISILRETGGDLTETFETITNTIRERRKIDGKIKALTHLGMFQGSLLACLPFVMAGFFYMINPKEMALFVTTPLGLGLILGGLTLIGVAGYIIKKIVTIDI
jgi:tight adherence protein B